MEEYRKSKELELKIKYIIEEELKKADVLHKRINVLVHQFKTVGVQGDERSYAYPTEIEIISNESKRIYEDCLEKIASRIPNEIKDINRVLYKIKTKT